MAWNTRKSVIDFTSDITERTTHFTGREWVFKIINDWLASPQQSRFFLLKGEPGIGKTAISARLSQFSQGMLLPVGMSHLTPNFLSAIHFCSARNSLSIDPFVFINSIATQFANRYPSYYKMLEDVHKDQDVQINVRQHVQEVNGQVIGVIINVNAPSPVSAFNRVVRQPLEALLDQERGQIVILVDALDEALSYGSDHNIVALLTKLNNLSPRVRFLLTSRPDTNVEQELLDADELVLSAAQHDQSNQDDIRRYVEGRLSNDKELAEKAAKVAPTCKAELMQTVPYKAEGNFQYVRFLLDAMTKGIRPLTELEGLPEGLDALYFDSLGRVARLKDSDWLKEGYAQLVAILSVAQEPLTFAQLVAFTKLGESTTLRYLRDLWQFIEKGEQQQEEIYFLYHESFIDFLRRRSITSTNGKKTLHNTFYLAANECHEMVANRCEDGGLVIIWEDMKYNAGEQERREYARRHYVTHLYYAYTPQTSAQGWKRLFEVLDAGQYGQAKIRYDPSMHLYAQDLDLGRKAAAWEGYGFEKRLALLPYLWRYTFLRCSLSSRVDQYPIELFQLLLLLQREQEVIGLAELVTNPEDKVKVLILVAEHLADQHARKDESIQIFLRAFNVASNIYDIKNKSRALRSVVEALVQAEQWDWAEEIAYTIEVDYERTRALCKLADALMQVEQRERAEGIWIQAEEIAGTIEPDFERVWTLSDLAKAWMQVEQWDRAEEIADCIESGFYREGALRDLAEALIQAEQWDRAEVIIRGIEVDYTRLQALIKLAHQLSEAGQEERAEKIWMQAEVTARSIKDDRGVQALSKLAEALMQAGQEKWAKRIWKQAETVAFGIEQDYERVRALSNLAVALVQAGRWVRAEVVASGIKKGNSIAERARESELGSFHDRPRDTEQVDDRSWALGKLAEALIQAEQWDRAEAIARDIEQNGTRAWTLVQLAGTLMQAGQEKLAERLWMQAEAIARNIRQDDTRAWVLDELAKALIQAKQWDWAETIAHSIGKDDARADTVEKSAEQWKYGVAIDRSYEQDLVRDGVLDTLVKALVQAKHWDHAEAVARSFERDYKRDWALSDLAEALAQAEQWDRAEAVARGIEKSDIKVKALTKLAIGLVQTGQREHAKTICAFAEAVTHGFEPDNERAQALGDLAKALAQSGQWEQAEAVAYCIEESNENNTRTKVEALSELAYALAQAGQWERAEEIVRDFEKDYDRDSALSELAYALAQAGQWERAEALVRSIEEDYSRDEALDKIVEAFVQTEHWERAEAMTCIIKQDYKRAKALSKLANALVQAGQCDRVEAVVRNFKSRYNSDKTLSELAKALVQAGQWERAEAVVRSIEQDNEKDQTLGELAAILAQFRQWERAEAVVRSIRQDYERARALGKLAEALMRIGQAARAKEFWAQAEVLVREIEQHYTTVQVLEELAAILAQFRQWEQAEAVVRSIKQDYKRAKALGKLAEALVRVGQAERAEEIWMQAGALARGVEEEETRAWALSNLAEALVRIGQTERAEEFWVQAEVVVRRIEPDFERERALGELAEALAQAGQWDRVEGIVRSFEWDHEQAKVLGELAAIFVQAGQEKRAEALIHDIVGDFDRDDALENLAKALVQTEQWERAEEIARDIKADYKRAHVIWKLREAPFAGRENRAPRLLSLVQHSWLQVEKRAHALQLFSLVCSLSPLKPEIGTAFFESFQWVDGILKG